MKPASALLTAAGVFNLNVTNYDDGQIIGRILNVSVYAGEIRRLNKAIEDEDARRAVPDPADDGPEVGLIRAFRIYPEGSYGGIYWRKIRDSRS